MSPSPSGSVRKSRRYGFACGACKTRKVKCSGEQPVCAGCRRSGEACAWPLNRAAETRLRDDTDVQVEQQQQHEVVMDDQHQQASPPIPSYHQPTPLSSSRTVHRRTSRLGPSPLTTATDASPSSQSTNAEVSNSLWFQVGIGENGAVIYNGPTSRFHAGSLADDGHLEDESELKREHTAVLQGQYALMDSVWVPLIAAKPSIDGTGVGTKTGIALLDIYWNWLHPLHSCVYRPILLMDLALGGPHCSDFLLLCIFGLAARHLPKDNPEFEGVGQGDDLIARAKLLLLKEMSAPSPKIPTIQGLLILGGRQCAMGNSSEGWLYTGMAIRMMMDMGLHLDIIGLARLERWTPAEIEARKRLYNAAYLWDKTLSLSLGRSPSLTRQPYPASEILDKFDDNRPWKPVHATEVCESFTSTPCWSTSTFCAFSSLHEITTDMMVLFSSSGGTENFAVQIEQLDSRCRLWYDETPAYLKVDEPETMEQSPPPHIVSLNLLYHTLRILLRRPYLNAPGQDLRDEHLRECTVHSKKIHAIHQLYTKTFPHRLITYQVSYCIYTAATVEAYELRRISDPKERQDAASRLAAAVTVLQKEASHTPGSGRSLDTIRRLLSAGHRVQSSASRDRFEEGQSLGKLPHTQPLDDGQAGAGGEEQHVHSPAHQQGYMAQEHAQVQANFYDRVWDENFVYGATNTGAGFHPDAFPWWSLDNIARIPQVPAWGQPG